MTNQNIVAGPAKLFKATAGTVFTPGVYPDPPTGFTVLASGLIAPEGIKFQRDWATTYEYVLAHAEPVAELLDTALTTLMFEIVDSSQAALGDIFGNAPAANVLDITATPGRLPEMAIVVQRGSSANGSNKKEALWFPRCTIKPNGETTRRGGSATRIPVMLSVLYDITRATAGKTYIEA